MKPVYQRIWFIWLMVFLFFPVGFVLMWLYSGYTKKAICLIMIGFLVLLSFGNAQKRESPKTVPPPPQQQATQEAKNISKADFFDLSEKQIALAMAAPVVDMNLGDYWEMSQDTGLTITKGTFRHEGKKHSFKCKFGTATAEPIALYIDDQRIFWLEERQDEIVDAKMAEDAKHGAGTNP